MSASHQSRRGRQPFRAWLRLCLLLTLWQAPVPLVHAHDAAGWSASDLARHVRDFHGDEACPGDCDWHWHLVLPAWGQPALPDQADESPAARVQFEQTLVRLDDGVSLGPAAHLVTDLVQWCTPADRAAPPPATSAGFDSYLSTYLTAVPLHQLLCAIRC